jgi:hypothetical protein
MSRRTQKDRRRSAVQAVRALSVAACFFGLVEAAAAGEFESTLYDPIEPGQFSTFSVPGQPNETATVQTGFETVNSVQTRVIAFTGGEDPGSRDNVTNDELGIRTHRLFIPNIIIPGFPVFDRTITFTPPIRDLFAAFDLGEVVQSQGNAFIQDSDGFSITVSFDQTTTIGQFEEITVPFGTFPAVRIDQTLTLSDGVETEISTQTIWAAAGLGAVKVEDTTEPTTIVSELIDTNRMFVPEPTSALLQLFALSMLVLLRSGEPRLSGQRR